MSRPKRTEPKPKTYKGGTPEGKIKVYGVIDEAVNEKIVDFAKRFEVSQTKMVTIILETVVENDAWLIKAVSSSFAKRLYKAFGIDYEKNHQDDEENIEQEQD